MTDPCSILTFSPEYKQRPAAFTKIAYELFSNVRALYTQIDAQFTGRSSDESVGAQMAAFCVYTCGLLSTYLCHYPSSKRSCLSLLGHRKINSFQSAQILASAATDI